MAVDWSFMDDDEGNQAPAAPKEAPKRSAWGELVNALTPRNVLGSAAAGIGDIADLFTAPNTFTNPNPQEGTPHRSIAGEALTAAGAAPEPGDPYAERMRRKTGGTVSDSRVGRVIDSGIRGVAGALATGPGALTTAGVRALPKALGVETAAGGVGGMAGEIGDEVAGTPGRAVASVLGGLTGGVAAAKFIPPVKNAKVTSPYGRRTAPKAGASSDHRGIDFRAPVGTPVQASAPGKVINRGSGGKAGNWIEVDYGNGVTSKYLHLQDANIKVGQKINAGDVIARTGKSGNVTGPHLHWAVYKNGKPVDPMSVAFEGGGPRTPQGDVIDDVDDFMARGSADDYMIDDALDSTIARRSDVSDQEQEFAFQKAIAEKASAENLDHVELGAAYLRGDNPELVADIDARAQGVLAEMSAPKRTMADVIADEGGARRASTDEGEAAISSASGAFRQVRRDPDGTTFIEYRPTPDAAPIPIKMGIDNGVAEIAVDQFSTLANRLGPAKVREAMKELQEMYPEIKRFGGYRRSGAGKGRVQEIDSPSRTEEIRRIAETNNIDLKAARALYESTPAGGGEAPPLPPRGGDGDGGDDGGTPPPGKGDGTPPESGDVVAKLSRALKAAVPLRKKQEEGYSRARGRKFSDMAQVRQHTDGVEGFYSELGALRGELPKQDFSAIMENFTQADLDQLFNMVKDNPRLGMLDSLTARKGLMKMMEGRVPTDNEIDLLSRVFPKSMIDDLMSARPMMKKFMEGASNVLNIPRSLMASFDMSAPLRQGIFLAGRKDFYGSFVEMFKHLSKKNHREIMDAIIARPTYKQMQKAGLNLADIDSPFLLKREEDFMSKIAEKVPGVRMSNQAYSGFLNTLRADVFDTILKHWDEIGFDYKEDPRTLKSLGKYINTATGRGDLGQFNQAVPFLNTMLFSPRLIASRLQLMNPIFYAKLDPMVRKQAFRDLLSFGGAANAILGLTSMAAGAGILGAATTVGSEPTSADFGKIKTGDTRLDITGGFQPYIRLASQLAMGKVTSTASGKVTELNSGKYGAPTKADKIGEFLASKESPVLSFLHEQFGRGGQNVIGEEVPLSKAILERITPMFVGGAIDAYKEYGPAGLVTAPPSFFGVGVQTYKAKPKKEKASKSDDHWGFMEDSKGNSEKEEDWSWME